MTRYHSGWGPHDTYLQDNTPFTEREATVLALRKTGHSAAEIGETLNLPVDTVENHLDDIQTKIDRAQELCTIVGPHPWGDGDTRQSDDIDDTPWSLLASAVMDYADEGRTRVEFELYHGVFRTVDNSFLLVEREIVDVSDHATETTERRGAYNSNALRGYIYDDADTVDEFYLRKILLEKAGIDPTAGYAPSIETVLDREVSRAEEEAARERVEDQVELHTLDTVIAKYRG